MPKATQAAQRAAAANASDDDFEDEDPGDGTILVQLGRKGRRVPGKPGATKIFHEFDDRHPGGPDGGEALVTGGSVVRVYPTMRVATAIAEGLLERVERGEETVRPNVVDILEDRAAADAAQQAADVTPPDGGDSGADGQDKGDSKAENKSK